MSPSDSISSESGSISFRLYFLFQSIFSQYKQYHMVLDNQSQQNPNSTDSDRVSNHFAKMSDIMVQFYCRMQVSWYSHWHLTSKCHQKHLVKTCQIKSRKQLSCKTSQINLKTSCLTSKICWPKQFHSFFFIANQTITVFFCGNSYCP